jgi:hypothetical protein
MMALQRGNRSILAGVNYVAAAEHTFMPGVYLDREEGGLIGVTLDL